MSTTATTPDHLVEIPLSLIDPDPNQPRRTFVQSTIEDLAASIATADLVQPIIVRPNPEKNARYILLYGERRYRALKLLAEKDSGRWGSTICIVRKGTLQPLSHQVAENLHREDLNPIDQAHALRRMHEEEGRTWEEISDMTRLSVPTLLNRQRLLALPPDIQQLIMDGKLNQTQALQLRNYSGPEKELIRLAQSLAAGYDPLELEIAKLAKRRERRVYSGPSDSPEGQLRKILELAWRAPSYIRKLEAFRQLPGVDRQRVWRKLQGPARENLLRQLGALNNACSIFMQTLSMEPSDSEQELTARPTPHTERTAPSPVKVSQPRPLQISEQGVKNALILLNHLRGALTSKWIELGSTKMGSLLETSSKPEVQRQTLNALRTVGVLWRSPMDASRSMKGELIHLISEVRFDFGDRSFADFVELIRRKNISPDPVDLRPLLGPL